MYLYMYMYVFSDHFNLWNKTNNDEINNKKQKQI